MTDFTVWLYKCGISVFEIWETLTFVRSVLPFKLIITVQNIKQAATTFI